LPPVAALAAFLVVLLVAPGVVATITSGVDGTNVGAAVALLEGVDVPRGPTPVARDHAREGAELAVAHRPADLKGLAVEGDRRHGAAGDGGGVAGQVAQQLAHARRGDAGGERPGV